MHCHILQVYHTSGARPGRRACRRSRQYIAIFRVEFALFFLSLSTQLRTKPPSPHRVVDRREEERQDGEQDQTQRTTAPDCAREQNTEAKYERRA